MKTLKQAFSQVNKAMGDEGMNTTQLAWYIDAAQMVLEEIARDVYLWQKERWFYITSSEADATPGTETITQAATNFKAPDVITVPDYNVHSFAVQPSSSKSVSFFPMQDIQHTIVIPAADSPRMTLRVTRGDYECKEFPYTSIQAALDLNRPFWNNDSDLSGLAYATKYMPDGSLELFFADVFNDGEGVYVSFTSDRPADIGKVDGTTTVPDFVYLALLEGMTYHIAKDFFNRGADNMERRMLHAKKMYEEEKTKCIAYTRNLKNRRSTLILEPIKWLSDTKQVFY
jgi:hypothetical protein